MLRKILKQNQGLSTIELVVAIAIFALLGVAFLSTILFSGKLNNLNKGKLGAMAILDHKLEEARARPYSQIGVVGQEPSGAYPDQEEIEMQGIKYKLSYLAYWVDDPQDGLGADDTDHNTRDYKAFQIKINWFTNQKSHSLERLIYLYAPF